MDKAEKIAAHLKNKYEPRAIVLIGSRTGPTYQRTSDWDLYVFVDKEVDGGTEVFAGENLDVVLVTLPLAKNYILQARQQSVKTFKVLYDNSDGLIQEIITRTQITFKKGPSKLSQRKYENRKNRSGRILQKVISGQAEPIAFFYWLGFFLDLVLRYWFEFRQEWTRPTGAAILYIKQEDKSFYSLLLEIISRDKEVQIKACQKIYAKLFESHSHGL